MGVDRTMATIFSLLILVQESDDGFGTFMARATDSVPRKPVHGGHGAADAAIHDSATSADSSFPSFPSLRRRRRPPSASATAMMLTTSCSPLLCVG